MPALELFFHNFSSFNDLIEMVGACKKVNAGSMC